MTTFTTIMQPDRKRKFHAVNPMRVRFSATLAADLLNATEDATLMNIPPGYDISSAILTVSATLGTNSVIALRVGTTKITGDTTAGGASTVTQSVMSPISTSAQTLNILCSTADFAAAATLTVAFTIAPATVVTIP